MCLSRQPYIPNLLYFFMLYFIFIFVHGLCLSVYICVRGCVSLEARKWHWSSWNWSLGSCELPNVGARNQSPIPIY